METNNRTKCYFTDEEIAILEQEFAKHRPFYEVIRLRMNERWIGENTVIRMLGKNNMQLGTKLFTQFRTNERVPTLEHKDFLNLLAISDQELEAFTADDAAWKLAKNALEIAKSYRPGIRPVCEIEKGTSLYAYFLKLQLRIPLPEKFELSEKENFDCLHELIHNHYTENNGEIPLWGKILNYELYRPYDTKDTCLRFDTNGTQMEMNESTNNKLIVSNQTNKFDTLFFNHLQLLMAKREQIFANPTYFMIPIRAILFYSRACLVAGSISCLPLGALLRIWSQEPTAIKPCNCGGTAVVVKSVLASLSSYTYTTFCLQCHKTSKEMKTGSNSHISAPFFAAKRTYSELALSASDEILNLIRELK